MSASAACAAPANLYRRRKWPAMKRFLRLFPVCLLLTSCRSWPPDATTVLLDVPFVPYHGNRCGIASLISVLRYYGRPFDAVHIEKELYLPAVGGTIPDLIAEAARKNGLSAKVVTGDFQSLQEWLQRGIPAVLYLGPQPGAAQGHFVVATGLALQPYAVRVHSGDQANQWLNLDTFLDCWQKGGWRAVVITSEPPH